MVIDFHTHIFPPLSRQRRAEWLRRDPTFASLFPRARARMATAEELVAAMDEAGVDMAVVAGIGWYDLELAQRSNDYLLEAVSRFPRRLVALCSVNPFWGEEAVQEVERCAAAGVCGIGELHPDTQEFELDNKAVMGELMETARHHNLLVLTHSSEPVGHHYPGKGTVTPSVLLGFIQNFPHNTIVCAHWGGGLPFYALMPEVATALGNVYFDTSASPLLYQPEVFPAVAKLIGTGRILFGTDFPLINHQRLLRQVQEASVSPEAREEILWRNAARLLGLSILEKR